MKTATWIMLIIYLIIALAVGGYLYVRYMNSLSSKTANPQPSPLLNSYNGVYYSDKSFLYLINTSELDIKTSQEWLEKIPASGPVKYLTFSDDEKLAYSSQINNTWQIKEINLATGQSQKIIPQSENFANIINPQYSPDKEALAFIAQGQEEKIIIQKGDKQESLSAAIKINDFSWSPDSKSIIYCGLARAANGCWLQKSGSEPTKLLDGEILVIQWPQKDSLVFLKKEDQTNNIFYSDADGQSVLKLTDIKPPKKVNYFKADNDGKRIVYTVLKDTFSDIYLVNNNASNNLQLTDNGISSQPIFSPDTKEIAYWQKNQGIFSLNLATLKPLKLVNLTSEINYLLLWR